MTAEGHKVASLHGAKDASERDAIIDSFREGREKVLITTNVIARGIDILQVNMVVNYDLPLLNERDNWGNKSDTRPDIETYIHRIGEFLSAPLIFPLCSAFICAIAMFVAMSPLASQARYVPDRGPPAHGGCQFSPAGAALAPAREASHGRTQSSDRDTEAGTRAYGSKERAPVRPLAFMRAGRRRSLEIGSGADPGPLQEPARMGRRARARVVQLIAPCRTYFCLYAASRLVSASSTARRWGRGQLSSLPASAHHLPCGTLQRRGVCARRLMATPRHRGHG